MTQPKSKNHILVFVCLVMFLDAVGFGLILPVLPDLIGELSGEANSASGEIATWLLATFAIMQFFFAPILGGLSDRFGRRPILLIALLGFALDYFLMALAPTLAWLFVARAISGLCGATYAAANACIVDISYKEERAKFFGLAGGAVALGFVFGPVMGGFLGEYHTRLPFVVAGICTLLTFLYGFYALPETLSRENRRPFKLLRANPVGNLIAIRHYPVVVAILVAVFLIQLSNQSYASIWSFYTIEIAGWGPLYIGLSVGFYGLMQAFVQGGLTGPVVKRYGEIKPFYFSVIIGVISTLGLSLATNGLQIYIWVFLAAFSAFAYPTMQSLVTARVPENAQGELQGAIMSLYSLSAIFGPLIMGRVFATYSDDVGRYMPGAPFVGAALLIVGAMLAFTVAVSRMDKKSPAK